MPGSGLVTSMSDCGNTHYAVVSFSGDPSNEHPDPDLNGRGPHLDLIASGSEQFCWDALAAWTLKHPIREWQAAEVLERHATVVIGKTDV